MGLLESILPLLFIELNGVLDEKLETNPIGEDEDRQFLVQKVSHKGQHFPWDLHKQSPVVLLFMADYDLLVSLKRQIVEGVRVSPRRGSCVLVET